MSGLRVGSNQSPAPAAPSYGLPDGCASATWAAMGTTLYLIAPQAAMSEAQERAQAIFAEWEAALSRFRPESELSQLNARAGEAVAVSDLLWRVLMTALEAARASQGIFDPTLGQQMVQIGYDRTFAALAGHADALPVTAPVLGGAWAGIRLDAARRRVTLPLGAQLDFGGIAKGMCVDAVIADLASCAITPVLMNAGGDLAVHGTPPKGAWVLAVPGAGAPDAVALRGGALATSSIGQRRWRQGEQERHHLLDPRTGAPVANGVWAVTVAANTCGQAEVAAKVALILGEGQGRAFLERWGIAGRFVMEDGRSVHTNGWPTEE